MTSAVNGSSGFQIGINTFGDFFKDSPQEVSQITYNNESKGTIELTLSDNPSFYLQMDADVIRRVFEIFSKTTSPLHSNNLPESVKTFLTCIKTDLKQKPVQIVAERFSIFSGELIFSATKSKNYLNHFQIPATQPGHSRFVINFKQ